jgi:hypothetical protein
MRIVAANTQKRFGHTVRLIALEDLPYGKGYEGDVVTVKAGYARNFLIPKKKALYATPHNFDRQGMVDPDVESEEQRITRLEREASFDKKEEQYLKEADILKLYLRNKVVSAWKFGLHRFDSHVYPRIRACASCNPFWLAHLLSLPPQLKIWRVVDRNTQALHPGKVNAWNVRQKLSVQLNIDLEDHETLHIHSKTPLFHSELDEKKMEVILDEIDTAEACGIGIKKLGDYVAMITLTGGHVVPLRIAVLPKMP